MKTARVQACLIKDCRNAAARVIPMLGRVCATHSSRWKKWGDVHYTAQGQNKGKICSKRGRQTPADRAGMCRKHYRIARKQLNNNLETPCA